MISLTILCLLTKVALPSDWSAFGAANEVLLKLNIATYTKFILS